jgi:hypothetical protein
VSNTGVTGENGAGWSWDGLYRARYVCLSNYGDVSLSPPLSLSFSSSTLSVSSRGCWKEWR